MKFTDNQSSSALPEDAGGPQALYGPFYGLRERPFTLTPNPRFLYLSARQREALSNLRYGLTTPHGFLLLTGEAGTGKTTMLRAALAELGGSATRYVLINNPTLSRTEFCELVARGFELGDEAAASKARFLQVFQAFLEARSAEGSTAALVIDEAQSMPTELLEELRLLGNIESTSNKLLNIVVAGQPELIQRLHEPALEALRQRIALRCELKRFDQGETAAYIAGRLRIAGGLPQDIFTQEAVMLIYEVTGGLPRAVNVLCENALIAGFAEQLRPVAARVVREVAREFEMDRGTESQADGAAQRSGPVTPPDEGRSLLRTVRPKRRFSFFLWILAACLWAGPAWAQGTKAAQDAVAQAQSAAVPADYVIGAEDVLGVVFWRDPDMTGDVTVRPDGMITLPLIGEIRAAGLKPEALRDAIQKAAAKFLEDANVNVVVRQINSRKVFITGEVRTPNGYPLTGSLTVMQLIALAGGLNEYADREGITIMRVEQGQSRTFKFNYKDVSKGKNLSQNIELRPGDTVVVP